MNSTVITLSQPIMHGQTEITELELRPIIGKDMIGLRFEISQRDNGVGLIIDADTAFKLAYKLTGIPAGVLAQMAAPRCHRPVGGIAEFFALWPLDWERLIAVVAYTFRGGCGDPLQMDLDTLLWWFGAGRLAAKAAAGLGSLKVRL